MDFESPDVAKDFPGLYGPENSKRSQSRESIYSDEERTLRKDLLGKRKEKKESKKDKGYVAFEGESSEGEPDETKSPAKIKKNRSTFKFPGKDKKEKNSKSKEKDSKDKKEDEKENKTSKKDSKDCKKESKKIKNKEDKDKEKKKKEKPFKMKDKKKKSSEHASEERPVFGIPLREAVERSKSHDGIEIPAIVRECIDYIEEHGLSCEGIYRISGVKSKVRQLKCQYNQGEKVYLYEHEPHIVASLLKQFLRDLPEPILTKELMPKFEEAAAMKNEAKKVEALMKLIECLPLCNRLVLSWIFVHMLHVVKLEKRNKMSLQNISIVLTPTMQISHQVLNALFAHSDVLFKGVEIKKYVPPIELDSNRLSLELPDSPTVIESELYKQENLLNVIHAELNTGLRDTEKEEQLWEVQRVVTQLKRKLRFLKQVQDTSQTCLDENKEVRKTGKDGDASQCDSHTFPKAHCENVATTNVTSELKPRSDHCSETLVQKDLHSTKFENSNAIQQVPTVSNERLPAGRVADSVKQSEQQTVSFVVNEFIPPDVKRSIPRPPPFQRTDRKDDSHCTNREQQQNSQLSSAEYDEIMALRQEEIRLRVENEELLLLGEELRRKINSEKSEIERLRQEIAEYQVFYRYRPFSLDSTENSSSYSDDSSSSEADENKHLIHTLQELQKRNACLEKVNKELSQHIQREREACVNLKVQMKMALLEPHIHKV